MLTLSEAQWRALPDYGGSELCECEGDFCRIIRAAFPDIEVVFQP